MIKHTLIASAIGLAALVSAPVLAQGADDLWEVTANITLDGMRMPGAPTRVCARKGNTDNLVPVEDGCRVSDRKTMGNRTTYRVVCTGKDPMSGSGEMTTGPGSYRGMLKLSGKVDGDPVTMTTEYSGKRVGGCTAR
jgi:hypothetical protein